MSLKIEIKGRGRGRGNSGYISLPKGMGQMIRDILAAAGLEGEYMFADGHQVPTSGARQGIEHVTAILDPRTDHTFKFFAQPGGGNTGREFIVYCKEGAASPQEAVDAIMAYVEFVKSGQDVASAPPRPASKPTKQVDPAPTQPLKRGETGTDIGELRRLLAEVEAALAGVTHQIETEQAALANTNTAVSSKQVLLDEVTGSLDQVKAEIEPLESEISSVRDQIVELQKRQEALREQRRQVDERREVIQRAVRDRQRDLDNEVSAANVTRRKIDLLGPKRAKLARDAAEYREMLVLEQAALLETRVEIATDGLEAEDIDALIARLQAEKAKKAAQ